MGRMDADPNGAADTVAPCDDKIDIYNELVAVCHAYAGSRRHGWVAGQERRKVFLK